MGYELVNEEAVLELRQAMSKWVGVIRTGDEMAQALRFIKDMDQRLGGVSTNFDNMLAAATLISAAAYLREESRGGHYRIDFPDKNDDLRKRSEMTLADAIKLRDSV